MITGLGVGGLLMQLAALISSHAATNPTRPATTISTRLYLGRCSHFTAPPDVLHDWIAPHPQREDGQADSRAGDGQQPGASDQRGDDGQLCRCAS